MSARTKLVTACFQPDCDWFPIGPQDGPKITFRRPFTGSRYHYQEMHVIFDGLGRVDVWSEWESTRLTPPDHDPGRRQRLEAAMGL